MTFSLVARCLPVLAFLVVSCATPDRSSRVDTAPAKSTPTATKAAAPAVSAFVDVTVLPMDTDRVLPHQTVLVRGQRIEAVGPTDAIQVPADALRIDGRGRYLLPGLADMHVHLWNQGDMPLYLANGVTTVRNMWGAPLHQVWRQKIDDGTLLSPSIYTSSPVIDGPPAIWNGSEVVATAADAEAVVARQQQRGYAYLKVYNRLPLEAYDALVAAAKQRNMPVVGHVPNAVGLKHALESGQRSIEHLEGYVQALQADDSPVRGKFDPASKWAAIEHVDPKKIPAVVEATRSAGTWNCPTMVVVERFMNIARADTWRQAPEMRYVPPMTLASWDPSKDFRLKAAIDPKTVGLRTRLLELRSQLVGAMNAAGARIVAGTDAPNPFVVPGFALHDELELLVRAGLTPYQALRSATRSAAELLDATGEFGTIAPGLRADLVLVGADPLADVANVAKPLGVMVRGRWLPAESLQEMLDTLVASYAGTHDRFAGHPPLPAEGIPRFTTRYTRDANGTVFGEERLELQQLQDRRVVQSQESNDLPAPVRGRLRLELRGPGEVTSLALERDNQGMQTKIDASLEPGKVRWTATQSRMPPNSQEWPAGADAVLGTSQMAVWIPIAERVADLAVGGNRQIELWDLDPDGDLVEVRTALTLERKPDASETLGGGPVPVRVYDFKAVQLNATYTGKLLIDSAGWPVQLELELQTGHYRLRRVMP